MLRIMRCLTALVISLVVIMAEDQSQAEDLNFFGISVLAQKGTFLVTKKANVRARPMTESKKLGELKVGEEVQVVGRAKNGAGWNS